jgi:hypothetical protein
MLHFSSYLKINVFKAKKFMKGLLFTLEELAANITNQDEQRNGYN